MRKQAQDWLEDGRNDLRDARQMAEIGMYNWAVFAARQAAEKVLKAAYIVLRRADPPPIHSLPKLGRECFENIPEDVEIALYRLNREYLTTRYPDAVGGPTAEAFTSADARQAIQDSERIGQWIQRNIPSTS